ncbi:MAG TPA: D-alanyl-D-alanine carboxypeptidase [Alphaproteobacteria bacterium]|nr:D-alanyl-D-alanine carboxypeptidase [Alphaproteobacteria bacterium]
MKKILLMMSLAALYCSDANAFETNARNAILVDFDTGAYIYTKNHEDQMPPASMSKLMTVYIIFDKLKNGTLSLDDEFTVSENAWRKGGAASGGSTMFLKIGENVKVDDLLRGIIIQSGNDACIVAAENIAGSEEDFAMLMNETAEKLGLKNSVFANSTGLPDENQMMSAEDLAILARAIIKEFPEYYHIFQEKEFTHNGIKQGNRNPLLYSMSGADGLKTGHTEEAGFCLTGSAVRGDRRLIEVIAGLSSNKERSEESERLMSYGFREFSNYTLFTKGQVIDQARVWYGTEKTVDMIVPVDVVQTLKKNQTKGYQFKVVYDEPLKAPVKKGSKIGQIMITTPAGQLQKIDLIASKDVAKVGILNRLIENVKYYIGGNK